MESLPAVDKQCLSNQQQKIAAGAEFQASPQIVRNTPNDPIVVPVTAIAGKRMSGRTAIVPDEDTRRAIRIENVTRTCPWFKLCLDERGVPQSTDILRPSCFPRYDDLIRYGQQAAEAALNGTGFDYADNEGRFLIPQSKLDTNRAIKN